MSINFHSYRNKLPIFLLVTGAIFRILGTGAAAIWTDEAVTLYRAQTPLLQLWQNHAEQSGDIILELFLRPLLLISDSVWVLRLPSLLAGLGCLWLVWKLMQRFEFNPTQQLLTAAFVSFAPGLIWQAQSARPYSLLAFFFLLAIWSISEGRWLRFGLSLALMLYCHNIAPAFVGAALAVAWILYPSRWKKLLYVLLGVGFAWIPQFALIFFNQQWISLDIAPLPPFSLSWFAMSLIQAFWATTHTNGWAIYGSLVVLALTFALVFTRIKAHARLVPAVATIIPFLALFGLSAAATNLFVYRAIMPLGYTFFLWLGWELGLKGWRFNYRLAVAALWLLLVLGGYGVFRAADRGGYLDQVAAEIRSQWRTGDALVITTVTGYPFNYYLSDLPMIYQPISDNFFLQPPGRELVPARPPEQLPTRLWVIIPEDVLLDDAADLKALQLTQGTDPLFRVNYMQTSPLEVYLVKNTHPGE